MLRHWAQALPSRGRALDVAAGAGAQALWLAQRGLDVTAVDIAGEGLALLRAGAQAAGLVVDTVEADLVTDPLPTGPWALITCVNYLQRDLFPALAGALAPGGLLAFAQPTRLNLERHAHPSARFLLTPGELPGLAQRLEIVHASEEWRAHGRHEGWLIARRAAG